MVSILFPQQIRVPPTRDSLAEELLAGLIAQPEETGIVGRQLVYLLLSAGISPASGHRAFPCESDTPHKPH